MRFQIILLLAISSAVSGQSLKTQFDALLSTQYKPNETGATAIVAKGGKVIYRKAFGLANLEHKVPMTPEAVFEIGSITKQFTAISILMLVEEGKLNLNDPVDRWIINFPNGKAITIHHLLTHTSGIKAYTELDSWKKTWRQDLTPMEMIDLFKNEPVDFAPGEKWQYNNSGYFMLGYIIQLASGMSYPEFLEKRIFTPLAMKNTFYGNHSRIIANRADGYQRGDGLVNAEYISHTQPYAAGSIMSTVDDLLIWNTAVQGYKVVKKETLAKAQQDHPLNDGTPTHYGYGWALNEINGSPTIEHSGGIFGYTSNAIYLPQEDVYVAVLSNCDCQHPGDVSTRMAALAIGKPYADQASAVQLDEAYLRSLAGVYNFDDGSSRILSTDRGELYSQRAGSTNIKLFAADKTHFFFAEGFTSLEFVEKGGTKEVYFRNRVQSVHGVKSDKPGQSSVTIPLDVLKSYVGAYELEPGIDILITLDGSRLMAQTPGTGKREIIAESPTKFVMNPLGAQIEFIGEQGRITSLILLQNGQRISARRK